MFAKPNSFNYNICLYSKLRCKQWQSVHVCLPWGHFQNAIHGKWQTAKIQIFHHPASMCHKFTISTSKCMLLGVINLTYFHHGCHTHSRISNRRNSVINLLIFIILVSKVSFGGIQNIFQGLEIFQSSQRHKSQQYYQSWQKYNKQLSCNNLSAILNTFLKCWSLKKIKSQNNDFTSPSSYSS